MIKAKKNIHFFTILLKILFFLAVIWLFFNQIKKIAFKDWKSFSVESPTLLLAVIALITVNWGIEYLKWNVILKVTNQNVDRKIKFKSFLAGIITGLLTPNMLGNFIGRMFYFQRRQRSSIILLTLFSNATQFLASIFFGICAVCWLGLPTRNFYWNIDSFLIVAFALLAILTILYFYFERLPVKIIRQNKYVQRLLPIIAQKSAFRSKLLVLSLLRHAVFSIQYYLLLKAFGLEINVAWLGWIWQVFFWTTLIPSVWFGKLVIRESMALWILAPLTSAPGLILFASVFLWILNQAIPALIGIPYLRTSKHSL